jgi:hypothetical protein
MKPSAVLGTLVALVVALATVSWISSYSAPGKAPPAAVPIEPTHSEKTSEDDHAGHSHEAEPEDETKYNSNPFTPAESGPQPKAEAPNTNYHFDEMSFGDTETHEFTVRNTGKAPLKLARGPSTCSCTLPHVNGDEVPPGGEVSVKLEWTPKTVQEHFRQSAKIWTNDPETPMIDLVVEGMVMPKVFLMPAGSLSLGELEQGVAKSTTGLILSRLSDFEIKDIEKSSDLLSVETTPAEEEELEHYKAKKGFRVNITLAPSDEVGLIQESVTIHTNAPGSGESQRWTLSGSRPGPIKIHGRSWYAERQMVSLGRFPAAEGAKEIVSLFVVKADQPLEITSVESKSPITVSIDPQPALELPNRVQYRMTVEFPKGGVSGFYPVDDPLPIVVSTNHPLIPTLKFFFSYDAF